MLFEVIHFSERLKNPEYILYINFFIWYKKVDWDQGSASGTGSPGSHGHGPGNLGQEMGPGLIIKSGTGTGTQIQNLLDSGPGLKSKKSGTRDSSKDPGLEPGLCIFFWVLSFIKSICGTQIYETGKSGTQLFGTKEIWDSRCRSRDWDNTD